MPTKKSATPKIQTLHLADGTKISGESFGADTTRQGEVVFATGMVGYPESLTDPSYAGQILVLTYPLVGNYGVPETEAGSFDLECKFESEKIWVEGVIVSEYCAEHSHHEALESFGSWLRKNDIPAITGVDTRALTQKLREHGTILGQLGNEKTPPKKFRNPDLEDLVAAVTTDSPEFFASPKKNAKTVAILDCGMKLNILRSFLYRGVNVWRLPADHDLSGIEFDGLFISNGPGDPARNVKTIEAIRKQLKKNKPIFGICLGNQLLSLAAGAKTYKLPYGHRSQNQPVRDRLTGRCVVTSQNHGFAVDDKILPTGWQVWMENINDGSVEGIVHKTKPFCSVQYHPEACPGPVDTEYLFDDFISKL